MRIQICLTRLDIFLWPLQELRHSHQQISVLQNEVDTLRSDNVKLYEKIKFLQSYPTKVQYTVAQETSETQREGSLRDPKLNLSHNFYSYWTIRRRTIRILYPSFLTVFIR